MIKTEIKTQGKDVIVLGLVGYVIVELGRYRHDGNFVKVTEMKEKRADLYQSISTLPNKDPFDAAVISCLVSGGITRVYELINTPKSELLKIKGIGDMAISRIKKMLHE